MADEERTVIVLAYRDGLSQSEIADRLDWPLGTVKTRTRRALRHLRDTLESHWDTGDHGPAPTAVPVGPGAAGHARQDG
jgi:DNA-directed RNA polymerase specialized sigma24 family protein